MGKVIYLTGAPASGKSSTMHLLSTSMPDLLHWEYGARLTEHLKKRWPEVIQQDDLRRHSASVITAEDVEEVDRSLVAFVADHREMHNIVIDSHPVTKEMFGFRITPFSLEQFSRLSPDEIWVFYASPAVTIQRIVDNPGGRPLITEEEARFHTALQASVAATYGMSVGRAVYLFDTAGDRTELLTRLRERLQ